jgi:predicted PurR-regulated permease PerM
MGISSPPANSLGALRFRRAFLLILLFGISLLFVLVISRFLMAVFLAAVFAGLTYPLFRWIKRRLGGRPILAGLATIVLVVGGIVIPLAGFLALVAAEAVQMSQAAAAWFESQRDQLDDYWEWAERVPFVGGVLPAGDDVVEQLRELAGRAGPAIMGTLAAATRSALHFVLQTFILLYALFYFLVDGPVILRKILDYLPLSKGEENELLERFVSVTRATLKGSLLIGLIQGGLAGLAFWVAGVPGPAFWGTVMVVLSIIPAVGAALVWVPAVIYLFAIGQVFAPVALLVWSALVVSTVDNFLRPRLIGRDARMSDLLILLSTLGGIFLFGALGFIVGPIVAALFVTIVHIYGEAFRHVLPRLHDEPDEPAPSEPDKPAPSEPTAAAAPESDGGTKAT